MRSTRPPRSPCVALLAAAFLLPAPCLSRAQSTAAGGQLASAADADPDVLHLHGVVLDSSTGKPISRALVQGMGETLATLTDHDGRFALDVRYKNAPGSPGEQSLRAQFARIPSMVLAARKPGYVTYRPFASQRSIGLLNQDIELRLTPVAVLQGRVAATGEDRPEGVRLTLFMRRAQEGVGRWTQAGGTTTNSRGEFRFGNLEPGDYRLTTTEWSDRPQDPQSASRPGFRYAPVSYPPGSAAASGPSVHLSAGESAQVEFNLHPEMFYPVRIPLTFPAGGNPGLQIRVLRANAPTGFNLGYNGRDHAIEGLLPSGGYEVVCESFGPTASAAVASVTVSGAAVELQPVTMLPAPSIPVIVHQDRAHAQSSGAPTAPARGSVRGIDGVPRPDSPLQLQLIAEEGNRGPPGLEQTADPGALRLAHVPPGSYRVELWSTEGYVAAASSGGVDLLHQPLVVAPGAGVQPIEVTLRDDAATLTGTVAADAPPGAIAPPLFVFCVPAEPSTQRIQQTFALPASPFTVPNLPPGSYRIFASTRPLDTVEYRSEAWLKRNASKGYAVTLDAGATATVTLTSILDEDP